ncbi:hypothetical protein ATE84_1242 [Aquimarina sp. MAR_2010_214]|uniref:hypothetical protein n=1 Tax=Aquimarina sp. MAR_2010_214 TaxID=1250026 RepID=UPI000C70CF0D|nr:hypothetical protein [Aquimarina sp. MAR_2010_214]PKV49222.1 hypothetical protein ATE84_1242 [Aquimarina sp. MAR_2010_214]
METSENNLWNKTENWFLSDKIYRSSISIMIAVTIGLVYLSIEKLRGRTLTFNDSNTINLIELENEHLKTEIRLMKNEVFKTNLLLNHYGITSNKQN